MCFGVRDAIRATHEAASRSSSVAVLGQLVHNPVVDAALRQAGVARIEDPDQADLSRTHAVITAHGVSARRREAFARNARELTDTTCPLVRKAHDALALLVRQGCHPVVIGQLRHVEVQGLIGDYPDASVLLAEEDLARLPEGIPLGLVAQTTQPLETVLAWVDRVKRARPLQAVHFIDTVCHPTKQRQQALEDLLRFCQVIIVVGGHHSHNTRQLAAKATAAGVPAHHVERAGELDPAWLPDSGHVGVTAGTSTLDETVRDVVDRLRLLATAS
jgi:4-hydroxy-3-methylbut-2-enyl diphosphate reductase